MNFGTFHLYSQPPWMSDSDVINGVVYAVQHHADVILMSFSNPGYSASLQKAVDYAWAHGVVLRQPCRAKTEVL